MNYFKCILKTASFKKWWSLINKIKKRSGKHKLWIIKDMIQSFLKDGTGYLDYYYFQFETLPKQERTGYLTRGRNQNLVKLLNDTKAMEKFDQKYQFLQLFHSFAGRPYLLVTSYNQEQFEQFIQENPICFLKPNCGMGGVGIEKKEKSQFLYQYCLKKNLSLVEGEITQHSLLQSIYPNSVNTIRIVTVLKKELLIVTSFLRIGNGSYVDNTYQGGLVLPIDFETGQTEEYAVDLKDHLFQKHPLTKANLAQIKLPYWKEVKKLIKEVTEKIPEVAYVGWDIAITEQGPILVEANPYPGYDYQFPVFQKGKTAPYQKIQEFLKETP